MKRMMAILVLVVAVPAMAVVNFTVTGTTDGSGLVTISYATTDGDLPRGVALRVGLSDGAVVDTTTAAVVDPMFNTFIDWAYSNPQNFQVGQGNPLANPIAAGVLAGNASDFSISMGVLDGTGKQLAGPAISANLITLKLIKGTADQTTVTVAGDTLRGPASGVVGSVLTSNLTQTGIVKFAQPEPIKNTAPFYNDWVAFGKPNCWAYARNCKGDADGKTQGSVALGLVYVFSNDLNVLISGWNIKEAPKGAGIMSIPNAVCADFARDKQGSVALGYARVFSNDLNILIANWNIKEAPKGPGVADCMATGHYNFFLVP
jgi:hypothetical protein